MDNTQDKKEPNRIWFTCTYCDIKWPFNDFESHKNSKLHKENEAIFKKSNPKENGWICLDRAYFRSSETPQATRASPSLGTGFWEARIKELRENSIKKEIKMNLNQVWTKLERGDIKSDEAKEQVLAIVDEAVSNVKTIYQTPPPPPKISHLL